MSQPHGPGLRILVLTPQLPYPPHQGASLRNYHLLRYLAMDAGHQVSLLSFATPGSRPEDIEHLRTLCRAVRAVPAPVRSIAGRLWTLVTSPQPDMAWRLASEEYEQALAAWLADDEFDVLQVEGIEMARYLWRLPGKAGRPRPLVVFDDHNAEYLLQKRAFVADARHPARWLPAAYSLAQWLKLRCFERSVARRADRVVAVSEADAQALRDLDPRLRPAVVPNGVDLEAYQPGLPTLDGLARPSLVFTSKMDFRPNVDAVLWFSRQVLPRLWQRCPEAHFYAVGQSPSPRLDVLRTEPRITITGWVPDVRPYIAGADVYVVPLQVGGGTRLKVLQAMAMGRALVSTHLGVEGLGVTDGQELLLAGDPVAFARQIVALLGDEQRRHALGRCARAFVERGYGWQSIGPQLEAVYRAAEAQRRRE
jgi:sugar transferase (PEP-CTERM/EpsH1 system associated)